MSRKSAFTQAVHHVLEAYPEDSVDLAMMKIFPADQIGLQSHGNESKHSFISPRELQIFTQRQKSLDWVMQLSRDYDVSFICYIIMSHSQIG